MSDDDLRKMALREIIDEYLPTGQHCDGCRRDEYGWGCGEGIWTDNDGMLEAVWELVKSW